MSITLAMTIDIDAPPARVWPFLVDWEHLDRWMLEASDIKITSRLREGVGVEGMATIRIGGIKTRDPIRVIGWDPPARLAIDHLGWVKGSGVMVCTSIPGGTRLDWAETYRPPLGPLGFIGMTGFLPLLRRTFERDLRLLKKIVESS